MNTPKYSLQLRCAVDVDRMETEKALHSLWNDLAMGTNVFWSFYVVCIPTIVVRGIPGGFIF
jgi:hypothetical protein